MFKIDAADYMISICGNAALRELSSPGKSGSVFFLSQDDRFMIKTLRKSEVQVLVCLIYYGSTVQLPINVLFVLNNNCLRPCFDVRIRYPKITYFEYDIYIIQTGS